MSNIKGTEVVVVDTKDSNEKARRKCLRPAVLTKKQRKAQGVGKDQASAKLPNVRISSRKMRIVINLIKNKPVTEALAILKFTPKAASPVISKLVQSAVANAEVKNLEKEDLYIHSMTADQGPTLKRIMPRAQGRAARINKRTSIITVVLKERTL
jgi:large subunit ribosomal protein L22